MRSFDRLVWWLLHGYWDYISPLDIGTYILLEILHRLWSLRCRAYILRCRPLRIFPSSDKRALFASLPFSFRSKLSIFHVALVIAFFDALADARVFPLARFNISFHLASASKALFHYTPRHFIYFGQLRASAANFLFLRYRLHVVNLVYSFIFRWYISLISLSEFLRYYGSSY